MQYRTHKIIKKYESRFPLDRPYGEKDQFELLSSAGLM